MNAFPRQTNTLAVVSLVSGLLAWTLIPVLGSVAAIICGHLARSEIRSAPDRYEGDALALIGLILGWAQVVVTILGLIAIFLFFGGVAAFLLALGIGAAAAV
jgi:hypothetical protein